jgi:glyoxylate reductase
MIGPRPRVFVTRRIAEEAVERLRSADVDLDLWDDDLPPPSAALTEHMAGADAVLSLLTDRIDGALLDAAPTLRVISNLAVGTDNIDLTAATARGIAVGNTPGVLTESTADFAFALLLAAGRRVAEADRFVRDGRWITWGPGVLLGRDLYRATLGIIGFGAIGQAVARRALGFQTRVIYTRRSDAPPPTDLRHATRVSLTELLESTDFVSIHVPLTGDTRHLLSEREFATMQEGSVLVNTSRGGVIDQSALVRALSSEPARPAVAALDVTEIEPIPPDDPLLALPNVIVAPHIASADATTRRAMADTAVDNLLAGLRGDRLPFCVNPEIYA